ncbi:MAG: MFS transporter, partial [Alphaproteobacteria bacterium]|nr:MFS transporter [Alphaproteobacteria bacterium]
MSFRAVFRHRPFAVMWGGRLLTNIATLTQSVALNWSVYTLARQTHDEAASVFLAGLTGLAQFLPMFALALVAGETADRYDRRKIICCVGLLQTLCAASFTALTLQEHPHLSMFFIVAGFFGLARAF